MQKANNGQQAPRPVPPHPYVSEGLYYLPVVQDDAKARAFHLAMKRELLSGPPGQQARNDILGYRFQLMKQAADHQNNLVSMGAPKEQSTEYHPYKNL